MAFSGGDSVMTVVDRGFFLSANGGLTWDKQTLNTGYGNNNFTFKQIHYFGPDSIWLLADYWTGVTGSHSFSVGKFNSPNFKRFSFKPTGPSATAYKVGVYGKDTILMNSYGLFGWSLDGGVTFKDTSYASTYDDVYFALNRPVIYRYYAAGEYHKSLDYGQSFQEIQIPSQISQFNSLCSLDDDKVFIATDSKIWITSNDLKTLDSVDIKHLLPNGTYKRSPLIQTKTGGVFTSVHDKLIYSLNAGNTWNQVDVKDNELTCLFARNDTTLIGAIDYYYEDSTQLLKFEKYHNFSAPVARMRKDFDPGKSIFCAGQSIKLTAQVDPDAQNYWTTSTVSNYNANSITINLPQNTPSPVMVKLKTCRGSLCDTLTQYIDVEQYPTFNTPGQLYDSIVCYAYPQKVNQQMKAGNGYRIFREDSVVIVDTISREDYGNGLYIPADKIEPGIKYFMTQYYKGQCFDTSTTSAIKLNYYGPEPFKAETFVHDGKVCVLAEQDFPGDTFHLYVKNTDPNVEYSVFYNRQFGGPDSIDFKVSATNIEALGLWVEAKNPLGCRYNKQIDIPVYNPRGFLNNFFDYVLVGDVWSYDIETPSDTVNWTVTSGVTISNPNIKQPQVTFDTPGLKRFDVYMTKGGCVYDYVEYVEVVSPTAPVITQLDDCQKFDFNFNAVQAHLYPSHRDIAGNLYIPVTKKNGTYFTSYLRKYKRDGTLAWEKPVDTDSPQYAEGQFILGVTTNEKGEVFIVGQYNSKECKFSDSYSLNKTSNRYIMHGFYAKYDISGNIQWAVDLQGHIPYDIEYYGKDSILISTTSAHRHILESDNAIVKFRNGDHVFSPALAHVMLLNTEGAYLKDFSVTESKGRTQTESVFFYELEGGEDGIGPKLNVRGHDIFLDFYTEENVTSVSFGPHTLTTDSSLAHCYQGKLDLNDGWQYANNAFNSSYDFNDGPYGNLTYDNDGNAYYLMLTSGRADGKDDAVFSPTIIGKDKDTIMDQVWTHKLFSLDPTGKVRFVRSVSILGGTVVGIFVANNRLYTIMNSLGCYAYGTEGNFVGQDLPQDDNMTGVVYEISLDGDLQRTYAIPQVLSSYFTGTFFIASDPCGTIYTLDSKRESNPALCYIHSFQLDNECNKSECYDPTLSIDDVAYQPSGISLAPNPAHSEFSISGFDAIENVKLVDVSGRTVKEISAVDAQHINVEDLHSGVYQVIVKALQQGNKVNSVYKLVVE